jgi:hypothetical protein
MKTLIIKNITTYMSYLYLLLTFYTFIDDVRLNHSHLNSIYTNKILLLLTYKPYDELDLNKYFLDPHSFFSCFLKFFNFDELFYFVAPVMTSLVK